MTNRSSKSSKETKYYILVSDEYKFGIGDSDTYTLPQKIEFRIDKLKCFFREQINYIIPKLYKIERDNDEIDYEMDVDSEKISKMQFSGRTLGDQKVGRYYILTIRPRSKRTNNIAKYFND